MYNNLETDGSFCFGEKDLQSRPGGFYDTGKEFDNNT